MARKRTRPRVIGYMRVSTTNQSIGSQESKILKYANDEGFKVDEWVSVESVSASRGEKARKINVLMEMLKPGDTLIVSELSRLGRSVGQIIRLVEHLVNNKINLIAINENIRIKDGEQDLQTEILVTLFSLLSRIEHKLIRERVVAGQRAAMAKGVVMGRKPGTLNSKLDPHKDAIQELLNLGVPVTRVAERFNVSATGMHHFIRTRNLRADARSEVRPQPLKTKKPRTRS